MPLHGGLVLRLEGDAGVVRDSASIRIDAQPVMEDRFGETVQLMCPVAADCAVDLAAGPWVFSSGDSRYYIPPKGESVQPPPAPVAIVPLRIYRAARLSGEMVEPNHAKRIAVTVAASDGKGPSMKAQCSIAGQCFECLLPEGRHDLRVQIPGHVSEYRWGIEIRPEAHNDLGGFHFKTGSSLTGRLALDRGVSIKSLSGIRVVLEPSGLRTPKEKRNSAQTARADERGWFQFVNVAPGDYELTAVADGFFTESQTVVVISDREAELRHPLLITRPARIRATISPALDPSGQPWRIQLQRRLLDAHSLGKPTEDRADDRGEWSRLNSMPGTYLLSVMDERGSTWLSKDVVVAGETDLELLISTTDLSGELSVGGRPVGGKVTFQGRSWQSITMDVADDGTFAGKLSGPQDEPWMVQVESANVKRQLRDVRLDIQADGSAKVILQLPAGEISGRVVTPSGGPVEHGWLKVASHDGAESFLQVQLEEGGSFRIGGLPSGAYDIEANALLEQRPAASGVVVVNVTDDKRGEARSPEVKLTVHPDRHIRGRVVSQNTPVVGAEVSLFPADRRYIVAYRRPSDAHGRFETLLPQGTMAVDVLVTARGFATRMFYRRLNGDDVVIRMAQSGGELEVILPPFQFHDPQAVHPWVLHDGAIQHINGIAQVNWPDRRSTVRSSLIDPGTYSVCLAKEDQLAQLRMGIQHGVKCVSGMVPPFGRLTLNAAD